MAFIKKTSCDNYYVFDRSLTLEELENEYWNEPDFESSLIHKCHALRKVPLQELSIENVRMLISQKIGIKYLIPIAIEYLEVNPWCCGDYYNGDSLQSVLSTDICFWKCHTDLFYRLSEIMVAMKSMTEIFCSSLLPAWTNISGDN